MASLRRAIAKARAGKDPQIRAIEEEAGRLALLDGKTSHKERFRLRNELRAAQGLPPEKRKRGGFAGVADRNRNFVGNLAKNLAPALALIPGVGVPLAAAVGAAGKGIQKGANFGSILKQGLSTATMAGGLSGAASGLKAASAAGKGALGKVAGAGVGAVRGAMSPFKRPLAPAATMAAGTAASAAAGASGPWWQNPTITDAVVAGAPGGGNWWDTAKDVVGKVADKVGGVVTGGGGGGGLLDAGLLGLAGAQAVAAANASARSRGLSDNAINLAKQNWAAGEGLRTAGRTGMLEPSRRNLSTTHADPTNPFAGAPSAAVPPLPDPAAPPPVDPIARRRAPLTAAATKRPLSRVS